jgi:hypothetical protein
MRIHEIMSLAEVSKPFQPPRHVDFENALAADHALGDGLGEWFYTVAPEEIEARADAFSQFFSGFFRNGKLTIYRGLCGEEVRTEGHLYWTHNAVSARCYNSPASRDPDTILTAEISVNEVDWTKTCLLNIYAPEESEVRVKSGSRIVVSSPQKRILVA